MQHGTLGHILPLAFLLACSDDDESVGGSCNAHSDCVDPLAAKLRAACVAGQCTAIDLRKDDASACTQDSECRAEGAGCCPPCQRANLGSYVALSTSADLTLLACFPVPTCDPLPRRQLADLLRRGRRPLRAARLSYRSSSWKVSHSAW